MQTWETWQEASQLRSLVPFAPTDRRTEAKNIIAGLTSPDPAQDDADSIFYVKKYIWKERQITCMRKLQTHHLNSVKKETCLPSPPAPRPLE